MASGYAMEKIEPNFGLSHGHPTKLCAPRSKQAKKRLGVEKNSSRLLPLVQETGPTKSGC